MMMKMMMMAVVRVDEVMMKVVAVRVVLEEERVAEVELGCVSEQLNHLMLQLVWL